MAVLSSHDSALLRLLKELGMPDHCVEFRLIAKVGAVVMAEATYYPTLELNEDGELVKFTKRYRLVEIED